MSLNSGLDRRAFLRSAGMTALAGAVAAGAAVQPEHPRFDFDTIYNRIGTDCNRWDRQIAIYGRDKIEVPMGTADQDFRIAPVITRALRDRIGHENYGYLTMPLSYVESIVNWNKRRHGFEIDPDLLLHSDGVHPAIISTLRAFCRLEARCSSRRRSTTASTPTSGSSGAKRQKVR